MLPNRTPEYFLTVAREGNISRASEKLHITQPSLSQHIAKLEEGLGTRLFDRSRSPLTLTPAGELYRNYLESSDYLFQKFQSELNEVSTVRSRTVHIGLGSWRGSLLIPEILPAFLAETPDAQVFLHEFPVSELAQMIQNGIIDFAVMNTAGVPAENILTETICHERILLVMNRFDPLVPQLQADMAAGRQADLRILSGERHISLSQNLTVGRCVSNFLEKNRFVFPRQLRTTNNSTVLKLVAAGMGFCFLVETGLEDARSHPELVFFDLHSPDLELPLSLCTRRSSYLSPLARELITRIEEYYNSVIRRNQALSALLSFLPEQL